VIGWFAARRIERSWQDKIPSARRENLVRRYCTPVFRERFRLEMRHALEWNPIAWLQQYSLKARIGKWVLCLVFLLVEFAVLNAPDMARDAAGFILGLTLAGIYTFVAVSSFLEEKRSGALELLLVTPVSPDAIIFGRVWGLWKQFLPAGLVLAGFYIQKQIYMDRWDFNNSLRTELLVVCGFFALPVFATYFALRVKNLIAGAALTWVVLWLPILTKAETWYPTGDDSLLMSVLFLYVVFALVACFLLRHSLSRRIYSF
jgi:ABC-type Na+ efflux pump permease subunit